MADTTMRRLARERARDLRRSIGEQIRDVREARGLSFRDLAAASGVDRATISRAEVGDASLSSDRLAALGACLGVEASVRLYPATGPRLRDHTQALMIDALASVLHPRWRMRLEVPVWQPRRGVIDMVIDERSRATVISGEAHGQLRRAEHQLRWAAEKTAALATTLDGTPRVCRLLLLRSSADLRAVVEGAPALFATAYPGRCADAVQSLTGPETVFPDAAICWVEVRGRDSRLLTGAPRGVRVGR